MVIASGCKLDLKLGYMVIRGEEIRKVHLSEISTLIIENTSVSMTAMLLCELTRKRIKVILCDEVHNPYGEIAPYYGSHDTTAKIRAQITWRREVKNEVWKRLIQKKISNQAEVVSSIDENRADMLRRFASEVESGDPTNREGHAAKVYFNTLFGMDFSRRSDDPVNGLLNYGYAILLSAINREISALGFITQIGIFHDNVDNRFNLGYDLIEPLRPMVDSMVREMAPIMTTENKHGLARILNKTVMIDGRVQYLNNAIPIYVKSVTDALCSEDPTSVRFCVDEVQSSEADRLLRPACKDR